MASKKGAQDGQIAILTDESKIKEIRIEADEIITAAEHLQVANEDQHAQATSFLGRLARALKVAEDQRKFFVKPLKDQAKAIDAKFAEITDPLEAADATVREKVRIYLRKREDARLAEERRLQQEQAKANRAAKALGETPTLAPTALVVKPAEATVRTLDGTSTAVKIPVFEIIDINLVPDKYIRKEIRTKEVNDAIRAGVTDIPGLKCGWDFDTRVRA